MKRVIIIHGRGGAPDQTWRPWLRAELEERGFVIEVPAMPHTHHPVMQEWVTMLAKTVGDPDAETFLVGHSLGCITILRYLETLSTQETIGGAVLISGFYEPLWENYDAEDFVRGPIDWKAVKKACLSFRVIHGKDDDIVPLPFAERLAEKLQVALEVVPGEHLGRKERLKELPAALKAVVEIAGWGGMTR